MDFAPTDEQIAIADMARAFGEAEIAPHARAWEAEGTIPKELWTKAAELGLGGLFVPDDQGGSGLSRLDGVFVFSELSRACASVAAFLSIHNMVAALLSRHGEDAIRAQVLPDAISMDVVLSYCLTEPGSGSDAAALRTRAEHSGNGWRLTGTKAFISGGGYSDAYLVMARSGDAGPGGISAYLVVDGAEGLSFGGLEDKMGWRSQPTRQVQLDGTPAVLIGEQGKGFTYAMQALDGGRLNIAACSLGAAEAALDQTVAYVKERNAFGKPLAALQALQFKLADAEIEMQAARTLLHRAAWALDTRQPDATKLCATAKAFVTEAADRIVDTCLQLHGGYGYLADYGIEKRARDLRVHRILEGANEVMRMIVARDLLGR